MSVLWETSWRTQFAEERDERFLLRPEHLCHYGIMCLDDALTGIFKNDLVAIGADSGVGKSELVLNIARHNAKNGKKVVLFYLEGGEREAMRRLKWRDIVDFYYKNYSNTSLDMDYGKWVSNTINDPQGILRRIEEVVYEKYNEEFKNNFLVYPIPKDFGLNELDMALMTLRDNLTLGLTADLILIDHLQYFSLAEGETEIAGITKILRHCKHITDRLNVPIVLVSHLKKKSRERGLPDQEDFYGSSNIPKISSTSITISPDYQGEDRGRDRFPTFFRIVKSRTGVRSNIASRAVFNLKLRQYEDDYQVYKLDTFNKPEEVALNDNDKPSWSKKRAVVPEEIRWE